MPIVWLRAAIYLNQQKRLCTQEMAVCASAVVVILVWSMIIYHRFLAEVVVKFLIFNYSAELVIEVNQIAAIVKYTIIKWGLIVVKEVPQSRSSTTAKQCSGTTKKGARCRNRTKHTSGTMSSPPITNK